MEGQQTQHGVGVRERSDTRLDTPREYSVILHNDDFTPMDFVVEVLMKIFGHTFDEPNTLMLTVHTKGKAAVGVFTYDLAMTLAQVTMSQARASGYPLRATCEPA